MALSDFHKKCVHFALISVENQVFLREKSHVSLKIFEARVP